MAQTTADPTLAQMRRYLTTFRTQFMSGDSDLSYWHFVREEAIYWFASHYYDGMWSNLYSALSQSRFRPGILANGPEEGMANDLYEELIAKYIGD